MLKLHDVDAMHMLGFFPVEWRNIVLSLMSHHNATDKAMKVFDKVVALSQTDHNIRMPSMDVLISVLKSSISRYSSIKLTRISMFEMLPSTLRKNLCNFMELKREQISSDDWTEWLEFILKSNVGDGSCSLSKRKTEEQNNVPHVNDGSKQKVQRLSCKCSNISKHLNASCDVSTSPTDVLPSEEDVENELPVINSVASIQPSSSYVNKAIGPQQDCPLKDSSHVAVDKLITEEQSSPVKDFSPDVSEELICKESNRSSFCFINELNIQTLANHNCSVKVASDFDLSLYHFVKNCPIAEIEELCKQCCFRSICETALSGLVDVLSQFSDDLSVIAQKRIIKEAVVVRLSILDEEPSRSMYAALASCFRLPQRVVVDGLLLSLLLSPSFSNVHADVVKKLINDGYLTESISRDVLSTLFESMVEHSIVLSEPLLSSLQSLLNIQPKLTQSCITNLFYVMDKGKIELCKSVLSMKIVVQLLKNYAPYLEAHKELVLRVIDSNQTFMKRSALAQLKKFLP